MTDPLRAELLAAVAAPERELVARAYECARVAHSGQRRRSGEPYLTHPVAVARIITDLGLDAEAVCAALLHDTLEDTTVSREDIIIACGEPVAHIVEGVTKISALPHADSRHAQQAETFRKLVVFLADDIRVLIVKLADRLHNLRTVEWLARASAQRTARETLDIYAPLAGRLGLYALKGEMEDLAFRVLHPRRYGDLAVLVAHRREAREHAVAAFARDIEAALVHAGVDVRVDGRAKHLYSIFQKMTTTGKEFNEIYDLTALRVHVHDVADCYAAIGVVHTLWRPVPGRFKDYIAAPKRNGYQSLHSTVIPDDGVPIEIQVRTHDMHHVAERGIAAHWRYKEHPRWTAPLAELGAHSEGEDFLAALRRELGDQEVVVFTPAGEPRSLPAGATPIDFAYELHTEIGHRCVGAKVNGRLVPLAYSLRSGDFIEILTGSADRAPSRDWLEIATTHRAQAKIRQWYRREAREGSEVAGRERLRNALRRAGVSLDAAPTSAALLVTAEQMGMRRLDDLLRAIGDERVALVPVVRRVQAALAPHPTPAPLLPQSGAVRRARAADDLLITGVPAGVMVRTARCCTPLPGDPIRGYVSHGQGVTVHRTHCPNLTALAAREHERVLDLAWDPGQASARADIMVIAWERTRLLERIAGVIAEQGANIVSVEARAEGDLVRGRFGVEVVSAEALRRLIAAVRGIDGVMDAHRLDPAHPTP